MDMTAGLRRFAQEYQAYQQYKAYLLIQGGEPQDTRRFYLGECDDDANCITRATPLPAREVKERAFGGLAVQGLVAFLCCGLAYHKWRRVRAETV